MTGTPSDPGSDAPLRSSPAGPPPRPRWVTVAMVAGILLVALFLVLHLTGGGFGRH